MGGKNSIGDNFSKGSNTETLYVQVLDKDVFLNEGKIVLLLKCNEIIWWEFSHLFHNISPWAF